MLCEVVKAPSSLYISNRHSETESEAVSKHGAEPSYIFQLHRWRAGAFKGRGIVRTLK